MEEIALTGTRVRQLRSTRAYDISQSQVETPLPVVALFWRLLGQHRKRLGSVLDMGAGDCRFAKGGNFDRYVGVEIDKSRVDAARLPEDCQLVHGCVFRHDGQDYDACIGNPPYLRHHDIESPWKERTLADLARELDVRLSGHGNLYLYFMCLGLKRTHDRGLVALIVPYEWVSRPSAAGLRRYIMRKRWRVSVYRFKQRVFDNVLTTASISIIDKARRDGRWNYYDVEDDLSVHERDGVVSAKAGVLEYAKRGKVWALRGLSPGSQKVFVLTEGQRVHVGLNDRDVVPCVTTLRYVPRDLRLLTRAAYQKNFIQAGRKCWLVKSYGEVRSPAVDAYLESVPERDRGTWTCRNQEPWFKFRPHPVPRILVSSGFTRFGPKVLVNSVGALAVGSVYGIHSEEKLSRRALQDHILQTDFEAMIVAHAGSLKKVEPRQLNAVLNGYVQDGRAKV